MEVAQGVIPADHPHTADVHQTHEHEKSGTTMKQVALKVGACSLIIVGLGIAGYGFTSGGLGLSNIVKMLANGGPEIAVGGAGSIVVGVSGLFCCCLDRIVPHRKFEDDLQNLDKVVVEDTELEEIRNHTQQELVGIIKDLKQQIADYKTQVKDLESLLKEKDADIGNQTKTLKETAEEIKSLKVVVDDQNANICQVTTENKRLKKTLANVDQTGKKLGKERDKLSSEADKFQKENDKFQQEILALKKKESEFELENESLTAQIKELTLQYLTLEAEYRVLTTRVGDLKEIDEKVIAASKELSETQDKIHASLTTLDSIADKFGGLESLSEDLAPLVAALKNMKSETTETTTGL